MFGPFVPLSFAELQMPKPPMAAAVGVAAPELLLLAVTLLVFLFLMLVSGRRRSGQAESTSSEAGPWVRRFRAKREKNWILVDGSNVMHWEDNTPQIEPVRRVVAALKVQGLDPGVVFDANAGWKLVGRYLGENEFGEILGLPPDQVLVVPKGSPADPWLLTTARDISARIVTNDRFRDWASAHPEVNRPGFLVRGSLDGSGIWLEGMQDPATESRA